jgi:hypothetical protein
LTFSNKNSTSNKETRKLQEKEKTENAFAKNKILPSKIHKAEFFLQILTQSLYPKA